MIRFVGYVLMAIGGLIGTLCGLCTFVIAVSVLFVGTASRDLPDVLPVGGIPTVIGIGLFLLGLALARSRRDRPSRDTNPKGIERSYE